MYNQTKEQESIVFRLSEVYCRVLPRATNVLKQTDLETLIDCLRGELDQINHAILALERMAGAGTARERGTTGRRPVRPPGKNSWSHHHKARPAENR